MVNATMASHMSSAVLKAKLKKNRRKVPTGPPKKAPIPAEHSDSESGSDFDSEDEEDPSDYKRGICNIIIRGKYIEFLLFFFPTKGEEKVIVVCRLIRIFFWVYGFM